MIESEKQPQWIYGPISCALYPCDELNDTLQALVEEEHSELLIHPRIIDLLKKKWDRFAKAYFYSRFIFTLFFLAVFVFITVKGPEEDEKDLSGLKALTGTAMLQPFDFLQQYVYLRVVGSLEDLGSILVTAGQIFIIFASSYKAYREIREILSHGIVSYFSGKGSQFLENATSLAFCVMFLVYHSIHLFYYYQIYLNNYLPEEEREEVVNYSVIPLSLSAMFGWSYLLFFFLGFKHTGPFVVMIYKMLMRDIARFTFLFLVFLLGFTQGWFFSLSLSLFHGLSLTLI